MATMHFAAATSFTVFRWHTLLQRPVVRLLLFRLQQQQQHRPPSSFLPSFLSLYFGLKDVDGGLGGWVQPHVHSFWLQDQC